MRTTNDIKYDVVKSQQIVGSLLARCHYDIMMSHIDKKNDIAKLGICIVILGGYPLIPWKLCTLGPP